MHQCINVVTFNFAISACPYHLKKIYEYAPQSRIESRRYFANLKVPFRKINMGYKGHMFIDPSVWNNLPGSMKKPPPVMFLNINSKINILAI